MTAVTVEEVVSLLRKHGRVENAEGVRRFGITSKALILGVPKPVLRRLAKRIGIDHSLALELWRTGIHEARILASMVADPRRMDEETLEEWVREVDNWDLADQLVLNLLWRLENAYEKAVAWCQRREEFTRRIGYALLARLVWRGKLGRREAEPIAWLVVEGAKDERPYVYKAVAWLLKQMAKRDELRGLAAELLGEIAGMNTRGSRFIAREVGRYMAVEG